MSERTPNQPETLPQVDPGEIMAFQIEEYHHIQDQAHRILRILIATIALVGIVSTRPIFSILTKAVPNTSEIEPRTSVLLSDKEIAFGFLDSGFPLSILVFLISIIFFLDGIRHMWKVLKFNNPVINQSVLIYPSWRKEHYSALLLNDAQMREMQKVIKSGYRRIEAGIILLAFGFMMIIFVLLNRPEFILLSILMITLIPVILAVDLMASGVRVYRSAKTPSYPEIVKEFRDRVDFTKYIPEEKVLIFVVLIYTPLWLLSFIFSIIWFINLFRL